MSGATARDCLLPKARSLIRGPKSLDFGRMSLRHEWKDAEKNVRFSPDRSPTVHGGKLPINPPKFMGREDTDRGHKYTRTKRARRSQDQTRPNPFQNRLPKNAPQEWGLQAQRNPPDARKSRTKSPFATQRPDTQFPIVDGQWIPKDTAFGTQESNSPFKDRPVVLLTRSAFLNPSAEV